MARPKHRKRKMNSRTPDETTDQGQNVEMHAETNLVDLAMNKKPLEFASEFHERMLGRIKDMLDPYREQIAHDLMKNEIDEEVEEIDEAKKKETKWRISAGYFTGTPGLKRKGPHKVKEDENFDLDNLTEEQTEYLLACIEEDEQLDELSRDTIKSYIKKANTGPKSGKRREGVNSAISNVLGKDKFKSIFGKYQKEEKELDEKNEFGKEYEQMYKERKQFFKKKSLKISKPFDKNNRFKEEVEPLDELSKGKLGSYIVGASKDMQDKAFWSGRENTKPMGDERERKNWKSSEKRRIGIRHATERLTKEDKLKEEVEPLDELSKKNS